jgi:FkbH-like protein
VVRELTSGFLISDFNVDPLARYLRNRTGLEVTSMPFNQVHRSLAGVEGEVAVVWVRPESVLPSFAKALDLADVDHGACLADVDEFADLLIQAAGRCRYFLMASWILPPSRRGYGLLDWKQGLGLTNLMARMNLRLAERISAQSNAYLLDSARWLAVTTQPSAAKMWFATKVPYPAPVFDAAAADIAAALQSLAGKSRRLLLLDLDNTMWGGVIGETGWQGIRLGGHDHVGEAFAAFQRAVKSLSNRGIQIALVSKNDEAVALDAFRHHPEMAVRLDDLAGWRIDWNDKAVNIAALVEELNLGLASAVFIDDNPHERARVSEALPDVLVPEWPQDPCLYADALLALDCFDTAAVNDEDRRRTEMYVADRGRRDSRTRIPSVDSWLSTLGTTVTIDDLKPENASRVAQLFNKTNQLNLSTRRLTERELFDWSASPQNRLIAVSVSDKFGDMGLCGILGISAKGEKAEVSDYILSCRVMGRGVEETMIHLATDAARKLGGRTLDAAYIATERNRPTLEVLQKSGLAEKAGGIFGWDLATPYEKPAYVTIADRRAPGM